MRANKKAFTLIELMLGVVLFSIIASLVAYSGNIVLKNMLEKSAVVLIYNLKADSERIASRRNYNPGDQKLLSFPISFEDYLSKSKLKNVTLTSGESTNKNIISISIISNEKAIYAIKVNEKCIIMMHTLSQIDNWAISNSQCRASNYNNNINWSIDRNSPYLL